MLGMFPVFEQTKDRNGKPSWFLYLHADAHAGRIAWADTGYVFQPVESAAYTVTQLRDIADFIEANA